MQGKTLRYMGGASLVVAMLAAWHYAAPFSAEYWVLTHDASIGAYSTYMGNETFGSRSDAELALRSTHPDPATTFYTAEGCRIVYSWTVADCRSIEEVPAR